MTDNGRTRMYAGLALAVGLAVAGVVAEVAARLWFDNDVLLYRVESPWYHHTLRPWASGTEIPDGRRTHYRIDEHGMRIALTDDRRRPAGGGLLVLGDSWAEGAAVEYEQSFTYLIGRELGMTTFNESVASYSPILHYLWLKRHIDEFTPALALLFLDIADVQDDLLYEALAVRDESGDVVSVQPLPVCWDRGTCAALEADARSWWLSSPLRAWIRRSCRACVAVSSALNSIGPPPARVVTTAEDECNLRFDRLAPARDACPASDWDHTLAWIGRIHDLFRERGIPLVLVTWPWPPQVAGDEFDLGRAAYLFKPGAVYRGDRFDARVAAFTAGRGLPHVSLYQPLREAKAARPDVRLYFRDDFHFTPDAHVVVTRAVVEWLRASGIGSGILGEP